MYNRFERFFILFVRHFGSDRAANRLYISYSNSRTQDREANHSDSDIAIIKRQWTECVIYRLIIDKVI